MSLSVSVTDGICELRIDAPPGNIIDRALCEELTAAVKEHAGDPHLKAFLIRASGKHFSFGASVPEHVLGKVEGFLPAFHHLLFAIVDAGPPFIAAVQGLCLGGGLELVAACQIVVAEESAAFSVPEITLGVMPPAACVLLPWRVGGAVAEDLILTGRRMQAREAQNHGLVSRVCADGQLDDTITKLLDTEVRPRSAATLRVAAKAVRAPLHAEMHVRLPILEEIYLEELMATRDAREGIDAFLEKREPQWTDA